MKLKINKNWAKFTILVISAIVVCNVVSSVVTKNLYNYVYPAEADSISIPILSTAIMFLVVTPFAVMVSFASLINYKTQNKFLFIAKALGYLMSYLILSSVAFGGVVYWHTPHHHLISYSYIALFLVIQAILIFDLFNTYTVYKMSRK